MQPLSAAGLRHRRLSPACAHGRAPESGCTRHLSSSRNWHLPHAGAQWCPRITAASFSMVCAVCVCVRACVRACVSLSVRVRMRNPPSTPCGLLHGRHGFETTHQAASSTAHNTQAITWPSPAPAPPSCPPPPPGHPAPVAAPAPVAPCTDATLACSRCRKRGRCSRYARLFLRYLRRTGVTPPTRSWQTR